MKSMTAVSVMMKYADFNISNCNENYKILVIFPVDYLNKTRNPNIEGPKIKTFGKFGFRIS